MEKVLLSFKSGNCQARHVHYQEAAGSTEASIFERVGHHSEVNMELKEEFLHLVQEVWSKLQGLPQASPLELGAFFVLILFIGTLIFMILICCIHCCCCGKPKYQASRVQPV